MKSLNGEVFVDFKTLSFESVDETSIVSHTYTQTSFLSIVFMVCLICGPLSLPTTPDTIFSPSVVLVCLLCLQQFAVCHLYALTVRSSSPFFSVLSQLCLGSSVPSVVLWAYSKRRLKRVWRSISSK